MTLYAVSFQTELELLDYVNGRKARGNIECPEPRFLAEGQTITISDGTTTEVFEVDRDASVTGLNVPIDISAATDNDREAVATALQAAIAGSALTTVSVASAYNVALEAAAIGTAPNVAITQVYPSYKFGVTGMAGGTAAVLFANMMPIIRNDGRFWLFHQ